MNLTARQRTKINAALCLLHDNGHNAKGIIRVANELVAGGVDTRTAYEMALNNYMPLAADLAPVVSKIFRLVEASDDRTVDQYDSALSEYVSSGDSGRTGTNDGNFHDVGNPGGAPVSTCIPSATAVVHARTREWSASHTQQS